MAQPYVYDSATEDFDNFGECGELTATSCEFEEIGNGMSEITMTHPYDSYGRWRYLIEGNFIKAEVPVRTLPPLDDGTVATVVEVWTVSAGATAANRSFYSKATKGKKKKTLAVGTVVRVTKKGTSRYYGSATLNVVKGKGKKKKTVKKTYSGWIPTAGITHTSDETLPADSSAIETVAPSVIVRDQLFRIYQVQKTETEVTVHARHVFYDALGDMTTFKYATAISCQDAIDGILDNCLGDVDLNGRTDIAGNLVGVEWKRKNPIDALLDPDEGLVSRWGGEIVRDDYDFAILHNAGLDRGIRIEYGKNMLGVDCELDTSEVITRIVPVGKTKSDTDLLLTRTVSTTYTTDYGSVTIPANQSWVPSPDHDEDYAIPHYSELEVSEAKESKKPAVSVQEARRIMVNAAMKRFAEEKVDTPAISVKVDFRLLGETLEYMQYRELESVHLYDTVRVYHPNVGIDITAKVTSVTYDVLLECMTAIELESLRANLATATVMSWQVKNLSGAKITGTINGGLLDTGLYSVEVTSSSGDEVSGTTVLSVNVYYGSEEITDDFLATDFTWYRNGIEYVDPIQGTSHAKSVTVYYNDLQGAVQFVCELDDTGEEEP